MIIGPRFVTGIVILATGIAVLVEVSTPLLVGTPILIASAAILLALIYIFVEIMPQRLSSCSWSRSTCRQALAPRG
jgi:uncharacterized membrane protein YesL